jgi:ABC-type transport system involved in multi-copper enzyme maturation permease subunit
MISAPLVRYVLTAARRDRLMLTLVLMVAMGAGLSLFMGAAAVIEQGQFSMVFASGGLRLLGVAGVVLFVCFYMRRAFENKEVEFLLSRPVSRMTFLFSHALAFVILALFVTALVVAPMLFAGAPSPGGLAVWSLSIAIEYAVMAVVAQFFSMVLSSAAGSALASLGFYVLARMIGVLIGIAAVPADKPVFAVLGKVMDVISVVVPRLDLMGQTSWLVYGVDGAGGLGLLGESGAYAAAMVAHLGPAGFAGAQGLLFIPLLLAAAAFDFLRRRF